LSGLFSSTITILVTVFIFGLLIFVHELGHYIAARKCGVGIIEFAIGMGPKIISWEGKYNTFSIRALPIGGFVSMVGEYTDEIQEKDKNKTPLDQVSVWRRLIIAFAGPLMNILLGFVVMSILVMTTEVIASTTVSEFREGAVSSQYGLMKNDVIKEINGKKIYVYTDMSYKIISDGTEPMEIKVLRNGEYVTLRDVQFPVEKTDGMSIGMVDFKVKIKEKTVGNVLYESFFQSVSTVYMTLDSLIDAIRGRYGIEVVSGPVGIGGEIGSVIKEGVVDNKVDIGGIVRNLANMLVFISVSLGVFNLLPIPVLDGGMILFCVIEIIRRKPVNKEIRQTLTAIFMVLLMAVIVLIFVKDFINLF